MHLPVPGAMGHVRMHSQGSRFFAVGRHLHKLPQIGNPAALLRSHQGWHLARRACIYPTVCVEEVHVRSTCAHPACNTVKGPTRIYVCDGSARGSSCEKLDSGGGGAIFFITLFKTYPILYHQGQNKIKCSVLESGRGETLTHLFFI